MKVIRDPHHGYFRPGEDWEVDDSVSSYRILHRYHGLFGYTMELIEFDVEDPHEEDFHRSHRARHVIAPAGRDHWLEEWPQPARVDAETRSRGAA